MGSDWAVVIDIILIFVFMFVAKMVKEKLGIFRSVVIPTALLAGFIGLILGPGALDLIQFDKGFYEKLTFHSMGLGFIALTLSEQSVEQKTDSIKSGLFIISSYCFQGVVGMLIVWGLIYTIKPDLFVGLGLMLPLAFGQGAGFASSIGTSWDEVLPYGFINQYGLALAAIGSLVGGVVGVIMLNYFIRKYKIPVVKLNKIKGLQTKQLTISSVEEVNFFDMLTVQLVWVALTYLGTYVSIWGIGVLLNTLGSLGETVASLIKGFNFLFGILIAILFKKIINFLSQRGHRSKPLLDSYIMNNVSSLFFNIMITASVMAISIEAIKDYWELLLAMTIFGTITTYIFTVWFGKKVFLKNTLGYILAMFGMMTGTASTGLALLRGIDPDLNTDVATNLVLGSAVATPLGIPLMVALGLPIIGYTENNLFYYYITFIAILIYMLVMMGIAVIKTRRE